MYSVNGREFFRIPVISDTTKKLTSVGEILTWSDSVDILTVTRNLPFGDNIVKRFKHDAK